MFDQIARDVNDLNDRLTRVEGQDILRPGVTVIRQSNQSIANVTATSISFSVPIKDSGGFWNGAQPTRLTVPVGMGGWYVITGCLNYEDDATGTGVRDTRILLNGGTYIGLTRQKATLVGEVVTNSTIYYLNTGDFIELLAYQSSGVARVVGYVANFSSVMSAVRIG